VLHVGRVGTLTQGGQKPTSVHLWWANSFSLASLWGGKAVPGTDSLLNGSRRGHLVPPLKAVSRIGAKSVR
jgi:hypothetical protein